MIKPLLNTAATTVTKKHEGPVNQINENNEYSPIIKFHQPVNGFQWLHRFSLAREHTNTVSL
jgi:hypothetical protein